LPTSCPQVINILEYNIPLWRDNFKYKILERVFFTEQIVFSRKKRQFLPVNSAVAGMFAESIKKPGNCFGAATRQPYHLTQQR